MSTLIPKFKQPYTNAVNRAINLKLQETLSIEILNMSEFCKKHGLVKSNLHVTLKSNGKHKGYQAMKYTPEVVTDYQASQVQPE